MVKNYFYPYIDPYIKAYLNSACLPQSVFSRELYVDNHLECLPFYKIPGAQRSQVHFASSTSLIV